MLFKTKPNKSAIKQRQNSHILGVYINIITEYFVSCEHR